MKKYINIVIVFMLFVSTNTYAYNNINTMVDVDTCSITILPNDTTIYSDTTIQLQLSTNQEADFYHWYPSTGLSDTTISNPIATISNSTRYILEATYTGINLINNGDFEQGNTGFYTDLTLLLGPTWRGRYNVVANAMLLDASFCPCNNGGNYMIVDGSETSNVIVYRSQATVKPNTDYTFSLDLSTINNDPNQPASQLADLYIYINNSLIENHFYPVAACCNWSKLTSTWNSGSDTIATVVIKDHNITPWGNDFAMDNVSLRTICRAYDTINITILPTISDVDTCSIRIPDDTTIYSINSVEYQLSSDQEADYYHWHPSTGLSDTTIPNPIATISNSIQYILEAIYESDSNLVYNGDFSLGNVGFTTQLNLSTYNPLQAGCYNIVTIANRYHSGFVPCTHNGGRFLVANGASTPNTIVYQTNVVVQPNIDYAVSFESTNISSSTIQNELPIFQFSINGLQLGNSFVISPTQCQWNRFHQTWNSGSNTTATITILNQNTLAGGNDFGIDNISLRKICRAYDTINIILLPDTIVNITYVNIPLCENDFPYNYYDSVFPQAGIYNYSFTNNNIVDSLHVVNITLLPSYNDTIFAYICAGETYSENGFNISDAGFYTNILTTINGCDSIISLYLGIYPTYSDTIYEYIYRGERYALNGFDETEDGLYVNTLLSINNCDSIIYLSLNVIKLMFPNVVTANGDGINDVFEIHDLFEGGIFLDNELFIFNRQGGKVYYKKNIKTKSDFWNPAKTNSTTGTYFYRFITKNRLKDIDCVGIIEVIR